MKQLKHAIHQRICSRRLGGHRLRYPTGRPQVGVAGALSSPASAHSGRAQVSTAADQVAVVRPFTPLQPKFAHNLFEMADSASLESCDFDGAKEKGNVEDVLVGVAHKFEKEGNFFFS